MTRGDKRLLVVLAVVVLAAGGFAWYWQATAGVPRVLSPGARQKGVPATIRDWRRLDTTSRERTNPCRSRGS